MHSFIHTYTHAYIYIYTHTYIQKGWADSCQILNLRETFTEIKELSKLIYNDNKNDINVDTAPYLEYMDEKIRKQKYPNLRHETVIATFERLSCNSASKSTSKTKRFQSLFKSADREVKAYSEILSELKQLQL